MSGTYAHVFLVYHAQGRADNEYYIITNDPYRLEHIVNTSIVVDDDDDDAPKVYVNAKSSYVHFMNGWL